VLEFGTIKTSNKHTLKADLMRQIVALLLMLIFISNTVLAHDGSEHVTPLERWIAGIGLLLILITGAVSFLSRPREKARHFEDDPPQSED
jgi:protein-S-isoprenylcysteine O-methyltransferase Ste14